MSKPSRAPMPCTTMCSGRVRGDPRVLLAQRTGRRVARVGEGLVAGLDQPGVELLERLHREVDLAADLDQLREPARPVSRSRDAPRWSARWA